MKKPFFVALLAALLAFAPAAVAESTTITVRVLSYQAKFIGTTMGGARITISDAETGEVLATGVTRGGTGDTEKIMTFDGHRHWSPMADEGSAAFTAELDLDRPRLLRVEARGPLAQRQAEMTASATQWVLPGHHITEGDGFLLVLRGFVVDVMAPQAHLRLAGTPQEIEVTANVTMMCGCPLSPGGLWNSDGSQIEMQVLRGGENLARLPMNYLGRHSHFGARYRVEEPGVYEFRVTAWDAASGNVGIDATTVIVTP